MPTAWFAKGVLAVTGPEVAVLCNDNEKEQWNVDDGKLSGEAVLVRGMHGLVLVGSGFCSCSCFWAWIWVWVWAWIWEAQDRGGTMSDLPSKIMRVKLSDG